MIKRLHVMESNNDNDGVFATPLFMDWVHYAVRRKCVASTAVLGQCRLTNHD